MGAAAYNRGSRAISAQYCRDRGCSGCSSCSDSVYREPRPTDWGSKVAAAAKARADGLVRYWRDRHPLDPLTVEDLADMIRMGMKCGRATATAAATSALPSGDDR